MAEALFLDGPLAGQVRAVPDRSPGEPVWDTFVVEQGAGFLHDGDRIPVTRHTYTRKPNRLSRGPRWAYALGAKVGEQVVCVLPYTPQAADAMGADTLDVMIRREAHNALARICADEGLVAAEVTEVFRGTRGEAREVWARENRDAPGAAQVLAAADSIDPEGEAARLLDGVTFVVTEAVAMPADSKGVMW